MSARFGIEVAYEVAGFVHVGGRGFEAFRYAFISPVGEVIEVLLYDVGGQPHFGLCVVHPAQLQQQAFLQGARPDARWFEALYHCQHLFHFVRGGLEALSKGHVVGYEVDVAAEVARIVERPQQLGGNSLLVRREPCGNKLLG